jgi:hypothetical protein
VHLLPAGKLEATPTAVGATASATSVSRLGSADMCTSRNRRARSDRLAEEDNKRHKGKHPLAPCTSSAEPTQTFISTPLTELTWASLTFASGFDRTTLSTNVSRSHKNCLCWNAVRQNQTMSVCGGGGDGGGGLWECVCKICKNHYIQTCATAYTRDIVQRINREAPRNGHTRRVSHRRRGGSCARGGGHEFWPRATEKKTGRVCVCVCVCECALCTECLHCG